MPTEIEELGRKLAEVQAQIMEIRDRVHSLRHLDETERRYNRLLFEMRCPDCGHRFGVHLTDDCRWHCADCKFSWPVNVTKEQLNVGRKPEPTETDKRGVAYATPQCFSEASKTEPRVRQTGGPGGAE